MSKTKLRRQAMLLPATAGMAAPMASASDSTKTAAHQSPGGCSTPRSAVAKTQYGKMRGYVDEGAVHITDSGTKALPAASTATHSTRSSPPE